MADDRHVPETKSVCIIGAGIAGLLAARSFLEEKCFNVVVLERSAVIGGLWAHNPQASHPGAYPTACYETLTCNLSRAFMGISDFPFPESADTFPTHLQVYQYFYSFVQRYSLESVIETETNVTSVTPLPHLRWRVCSVTHDNETTRDFDVVVVCTGQNSDPLIPEFTDRDLYRGRIMHSQSYDHPLTSELVGKRVLVIGGGASAIAILSDLATRGDCASVALSTRSPTWLLPRIVDGRPYDEETCRLVMEYLPASLRMRYINTFCYVLNPRPLEPPPSFDFARHRAIADTCVTQLVTSGRVAVHAGVSALTSTGVLLEDGTHVDADVLLCCTGYKRSFPFFSKELISEVVAPWVPFYRRVYSPVAPTLPFIGYCIPGGATWGVMELQAKWAARVASGELQLPQGRDMVNHVRWLQDKARKERWRDILFIPDRLKYMDKLARLLGCMPQMWRHPLLLPALMLLQPVSTQYALDGTRRWKGAVALLWRMQQKQLPLASALWCLFIYASVGAVAYRLLWMLFALLTRRRRPLRH